MTKIVELISCFLVIFITSSGGKGAVYSGISILIYQGFFTLCAFIINSNIDQIVSDSIAGIGGILLIGVGINLLGLKKIPVVTTTGIFYSLKEDDYRMATSFALLFMLYLARVQSHGRQYQYGSRYHPNG